MWWRLHGVVAQMIDYFKYRAAWEGRLSIFCFLSSSLWCAGGPGEGGHFLLKILYLFPRGLGTVSEVGTGMVLLVSMCVRRNISRGFWRVYGEASKRMHSHVSPFSPRIRRIPFLISLCLLYRPGELVRDVERKVKFFFSISLRVSIGMGIGRYAKGEE